MKIKILIETCFFLPLNINNCTLCCELLEVTFQPPGGIRLGIKVDILESKIEGKMWL